MLEFIKAARGSIYFAMAILGCAGPVYAQPSSEIDEDVNALIGATYYAIGFTGVGGLQSSGQTALIHMHLKPNRSLLFHEAYERGGVYAKLYVSCWAATFDPKYFSDICSKISKMYGETKVSEMHGSILRLRSVEDILSEQSKGDCGRLSVSGVK